ncbi:MAG: hypothetical protein AMXMBFR72_11850 [Betaproteobacteria bacterium]
MDIFKFRDRLIADYAEFSTSFTRIAAADIKIEVDREYADQRYWPAPLIQLNANYRRGKTVQALARDGVLHAGCGEIFRVGKDAGGGGSELTLYQHQEQAIALAQQGRSFVVTTGTGSGKSLTFFIPIIDRVLKTRAAEGKRRTRAIVIYPMNALANSQMEELRKFLTGFAAADGPIVVERYTGQEDDAKRQEVADNPPDILLTNFMMLELLLTRYEPTDRRVIDNCAGLEFLVLDELHTYRGRQGADVALLVRRLRQRLSSPRMLCIGTSATMSSVESEADKRAVVAGVASRLFGVPITANEVITETLERITDPTLGLEQVRPKLKAAVAAGVPAGDRLDAFRSHPVAAWLELTLGIEYPEGPSKPTRARPRTLDDAAKQFAQDAGIALEQARDYLTAFLLAATHVRDATGRSVFAFRLHQFISGAGKVWTSLEEPGKRVITLDGQRFVPGRQHEGHLLYSAHFCRECGQEYHPVWDSNRNGRRFDPREIDDTMAENDDVAFGFLMPDANGEIWKGDEADLPDTWLDFAYDPPRVKHSYRKAVPQEVRVDPTGLVGHGIRCWYTAGKFRFCLRCGFVHETYGRDQNRLASLSGEGRSSATTMIALAALRQLFEQNVPGSGESDPRKLLGFSDNRQDAALQAGHFNDFVFLLTLRAGLLRALQQAPGGELGGDAIGEATFKALGFDRDDLAARAEYLRNPRLIGLALRDAQATQRALLAHRLLYDLRRGWRFNNPNLEQLRLIDIDYTYVDDFAQDASLFAEPPPTILSLGAEGRAELARFVLAFLRESLCIESRYFDPAELERLRSRAYQDLKEPWGFAPDEEPFTGRYLITTKRPQGRGFANLVGGGSRSRLIRQLRQARFWSKYGLAPQIKTAPEAELIRLVDAVLSAAKRYGLVDSTTITEGVIGWRVRAGSLRWKLVSPDGAQPQSSVNVFFRALYRNVAAMLGDPAHALFDFESHEHTAQVDGAKRQWLEARFRFTPSDRERWNQEHPEEAELQRLPVMFCSPTMELGVDISALNHVYLRNVPPTPANYAQRSGRAGRSGQPALVITYCAAQSPHDQYFFRNQAAMVHGEVRAPTLDLANPDLVASHMHAVWLACAEIGLEPSIAPMLDLDRADKPLIDPWKSRFAESGVAEKARRAVREVLQQLRDELTPERAPWYSANYADDVVAQAPARFDAAMYRWRGLYEATDSQMTLADRVLRSHAVSPRERDQAQRRYNDAARQRKTLLRPGTSLNSDFYTYRYLASQGFLPGYNFPRLPLLAWIPARGGRDPGDDQGTMIARPRFLALGEFGPRSLIYHEGRIYRVVRALLQVSADQVGDGTTLPTIAARVCTVCGYGHLNAEQGGEPRADVCEGCGAALTDAGRINNLYRIENVATLPAERITVNDEERRRQGYEMQTTYRYGVDDDGNPQRDEAQVVDAAGAIVNLQYGPTATVWRVNRGWRRRKDRNQLGFMINPMTGWWSREDSPDETEGAQEEEAPGAAVASQRIVPFVEDRRNVLILRPVSPLSTEAMATLQIALKRGIEQTFQIEEAELIAEPLPHSKQRNAILMYEAAEGGAGVLTRLATDAGALAECARAALRLMHFNDPPTGQPWEAGTLDALEQLENGRRICEAGCYRCLLTYFNQPDHELIDRRDPTVLEVLTRLANGTTQPAAAAPAAGGKPVADLSPTAKRWLAAAEAHGARRPDAAAVALNGSAWHADFRYDQSRTMIFLSEPDAALRDWLHDRDWSAIFFSADESRWPEQFAAHAAVFGIGARTNGA